MLYLFKVSRKCVFFYILITSSHILYSYSKLKPIGSQEVSAGSLANVCSHNIL